MVWAPLGEVGDEGLDVDAVAVTQLDGRLLQPVIMARDEHQVTPTRRELARERSPSLQGPARHQRLLRLPP